MSIASSSSGSISAPVLSYDDAISTVERWAEALADSAETHPPSTPVPTAPGWDLAKLLRHTGRVHRHVTGLVRLRISGPPDHDTVTINQPGSEAGPDAWVAWFRDGSAQLIAELRSAQPTDAMWSWGVDQCVSFWARRMAHETVIHAVDGHLATSTGFRIEPAVAIDGLDEYLENLAYLRAVATPETPFTGSGTVHLHATDPDLAEGLGEWMIEFDADGCRFGHGHGKGDVAVRAPADTLELLALGRLNLEGDRHDGGQAGGGNKGGGNKGDGNKGAGPQEAGMAGIEVFGDPEVFQRWLAGATFR